MTKRPKYLYLITVSGGEPIERVSSMLKVFALLQYWLGKDREVTIERIEL